MKTMYIEFYDSKTNTIDWEYLEKYDWIRDMHGVPQDPIWHAEGDVYTHTKMVVETILVMPEFQSLCLTEKIILILAALFHDVEKRSTTTEEDGRYRSHNHSKKGEKSARLIMYREFDIPFIFREHIAKLVRFHGLPLNILDKRNPQRSVIESSMYVSNFLLGILAKGDVLGRIADDNPEQLEKIQYFIEYCKENNCYTDEKPFKSSLGRYSYLSGKSDYPDYEPYDETKFTVILMSGVPGTGKDTHIKQALDYPVISLDDIRRELGIEPTDKSGNGKVIQIAKEKAKEYMRKHTSFVWNATNITKQMRSQLIDLFTSYGGKVVIYYIEAPYQLLLARNKTREFPVPENVIEKMINKLEIPMWDESPEIFFVLHNC